MSKGQTHAAGMGEDELDPALDLLTMGGFITEITRRHAERYAFFYNGELLTYKELGDLVHLFARGLAAIGVTKGTRVGVLMSNRPEFVVAIFGATLIGAIAVPMSTFATPEERDYMLRHSDVAILITQKMLLKRNFVEELSSLHPLLASAKPGNLYDAAVPNLRRIFCLGLSRRSGAFETWDDLLIKGHAIPERLVNAMAANVVPTDDAMIQYTSGSTAFPKAVVHYHRSPCLQFPKAAEKVRMKSTDRVLAPYQFFWAFAQVPGAALASGACFFCMERFDPVLALDWIDRHHITVLWPTADQVSVLNEYAASKKHELSSVRLISKRGFAKTVGLRNQFFSSYGCIENCTSATALPVDAPLNLRLTTDGLPYETTEFEIVDPESGLPLPYGQIGEVAIKGPTVMRGYYKVERERCFDDRGFYRTKDLGFMDSDGYFHFTGRLSTMIKTSGANVSPIEVEKALLASGQVAKAIVLGVPHPQAGEAVVAVVVPKPDASIQEDALKAYVKAHIAAFKVPRRILFVEESDISPTGTEKVNLDKTRELAIHRLAAFGEDPTWTALLIEEEFRAKATPRIRPRTSVRARWR